MTNLKIEYKPSEEKTYITEEIFFVTDTKSKIGLRVVGDRAEFVAYNPSEEQYTAKEYYFLSSSGQVKINTLIDFIDAYTNRNN